MAGSYPDVPSRRFGWDGDGTVWLVRNVTTGSIFVEPGSSPRAECNDEDNVDINPNSFVTVGDGHTFRHVFIFPELREIDGLFARASSINKFGLVESSPDTNNGLDGTWSTVTSNHPDGDSTSVYDVYRTGIQSAAVSNVRGLAFDQTIGSGAFLFRAIHLYGDITPGETPDRLLFIDEATGLEFTASRDYGDIPRGGSEDVTWRIKNNSATLTASTIQYTTEALYLASAGWYTHTLPGGASYQSTRQVASLAPATTTGVITTRRITPGSETVGPHAGRTYLNVGTWS